MNIREVEATPFRIPFVRPLVIGESTVEARTGVLIRLYDDDGRVGLGEAAPHPLAGEAVLREAMPAVGVAQKLLHGGGPIEFGAVLDRLQAVPSSALRAGLEMACWDLAAQAAGVPLAEMLSPAAMPRVPVNAIIDALDPGDAASAARELVSQGVHCLKLKVGREVRRDVARLASVRAATGPRVRLRIDANGAWTLEEALAFLPQLVAYGLEYVEQPVADIPDLAQVRRAVDVPIAADECVTDAGAVRQLAALGAADIVVVKPALLGLHAAVSVVRTAQASGMGVVVTSALDTSVGIAAALHLAATLPEPVLPCGLATASLLAGDLARDSLMPRGGWLEVPRGPGLGVELDTESLRRWRDRVVVCERQDEGMSS
jgi:o-succinylbenzoate synthase